MGLVNELAIAKKYEMQDDEDETDMEDNSIDKDEESSPQMRSPYRTNNNGPFLEIEMSTKN